MHFSIKWTDFLLCAVGIKEDSGDAWFIFFYTYYVREYNSTGYSAVVCRLPDSIIKLVHYFWVIGVMCWSMCVRTRIKKFYDDGVSLPSLKIFVSRNEKRGTRVRIYVWSDLYCSIWVQNWSQNYNGVGNGFLASKFERSHDYEILDQICGSERGCIVGTGNVIFGSEMCVSPYGPPCRLKVLEQIRFC